MDKPKFKRKVYESGGISAGATGILLILEVLALIVLVRVFSLNYTESLIVAGTLILGFFLIILSVPRERRVVVQRVLPKVEEKKVEKEEVVKEKKPAVKTVSSNYVASTVTKMFHPTSSRSGRMIQPKNRVYSNSYKDMQKKGFKPSQKSKEFFKKNKK